MTANVRFTEQNWKLDESCISNPESEIRNWTPPHSHTGKSNLNFRISDLRCRIRPISKFNPLIWLSLLLAVFAFAPAPVLAQQDTEKAKTEAEQKQTEEAQPKTDGNGKLISVPGGKALGMSILGNQEAPKALVIVPWKRSELGNVLGISTLLDDSRQPIDKEVFMRMLSYYEIRSETTRPSGTPTKTTAAQPATAAPRRKP